MQLIEINSAEVKQNCPTFYGEGARYFMFIHNAQEVALFGVRKINDTDCTLSLFIFPEHRFKVPYRKGLSMFLKLPLDLGFKNIYMSSNVKAVLTLLKTCEIMGVKCLGLFDGLVWFLFRKDSQDVRW